MFGSRFPVSSPGKAMIHIYAKRRASVNQLSDEWNAAPDQKIGFVGQIAVDG
jgi:hypothetical protein